MNIQTKRYTSSSIEKNQLTSKYISDFLDIYKKEIDHGDTRKIALLVLSSLHFVKLELVINSVKF